MRNQFRRQEFHLGKIDFVRCEGIAAESDKLIMVVQVLRRPRKVTRMFAGLRYGAVSPIGLVHQGFCRSILR